jgi:hypothetical protein
LSPNKTAATRSVGLEILISWRVRFDANKCVAAMAVVKGRNETNLVPGGHVLTGVPPSFRRIDQLIGSPAPCQRDAPSAPVHPLRG